jgi:hypothetical protein
MEGYINKQRVHIKKIVHLKVFIQKIIVHSIANNSSKRKGSFSKGEFIQTNTIHLKATSTFRGEDFN